MIPYKKGGRIVSTAQQSSLDLTQGRIVPRILVYVLPIFAGQFLQNLYNSVDSIVVGRFAGTEALAAVSTCIDVSFLLIGFFNGLSTGAGVLFARYFGAKDRKMLHDSIHTAVAFSLIAGLVIATAGILLAPWLLQLMACPADAYNGALAYLRIYLVGVLFTSIYNIGASILRAVGDSRHPLYYLLVSCVINIVLDLLLTGALGLGEIGVGAATVAAQAVSCLLVFRQLSRTQDVYRFSVRELMLDRSILMDVIDLGIPAAIQASLTAFSNFFVQRYINTFGTYAIAGVGAAKKVDRFASLTCMSIGFAVTTFVSQNLGARNLKRAFQGVAVCQIIDLVCITCLGLPIYHFAPQLIALFDPSPATVAYGVAMVHTIIPLFFLQSLNQVAACATRGFGHSRSVMILSLLGMIVIRQIYLAVTLGHDHNIRYLYLGFPVGWGAAAALVLAYFVTRLLIPYLRGATIEQLSQLRSQTVKN